MSLLKTLEKSLSLVFKEKYPVIKMIKVSVDESMGFTYYTIFVGLKYDDLLTIDEHKLKQEIKDFSKMFALRDSVNVTLFDPEDSY